MRPLVRDVLLGADQPVVVVEAASRSASSSCSGQHPQGCFQLRNRDAGDRRRYDQYLGDKLIAGNVDAAAGCWFRERNQPMRLIALAAALVDTGRLDVCRAVLTAPAGHVSIRRRWTETAEMIGSETAGAMRPPAILEPATIAALAPPRRQAFLAGRYGIVPEAPITEQTNAAPSTNGPDYLSRELREALGWQLIAELMCRHPRSFHLIEMHPGDAAYRAAVA